jgi:hypothetical protein
MILKFLIVEMMHRRSLDRVFPNLFSPTIENLTLQLFDSIGDIDFSGGHH